MRTAFQKRHEARATRFAEEQEEAKHVWGKYRAIIAGLPPALRDCADRYVDERDSGCSHAIPLNAIVPLLLAEPFGLEDSEIKRRVALANLHLDHCIQLVDDFTDNPGEGAASNLHLSHILMAKATALYLESSNDAHKLSAAIERYLREAAEAERYLWKHRGVLLEYDAADLLMIGRRGSLLKISASVYADVTGEWGYVDFLSKGLDAASTGIQLVDDVLDWKDDFSKRIYTYPLVLALRDNKSGKESCREAEVECLLFQGSAVTETLFLAERHFQQARATFQKVQARSIVLFTDELLSQICQLKQLIHKAVHGGPFAPGNLTTLMRRHADVRLQH